MPLSGLAVIGIDRSRAGGGPGPNG